MKYNGLNLNKYRGFTLIELMVVVAILGILSMLALQNFKSYTYRAKRAEAQIYLNSLHTLELAYFDIYQTFTTMIPSGRGFGTPGHATDCNQVNNLGFWLQDCNKVRYQYEVTIGTSYEYTSTASSLTGSDNVVFPGCATADVWTMNEQRHFINTSNGFVACI